MRTSEATVVDGDVLGALQFRASAETGADALAVAASIIAEADDEFDADSAATDFVFKLGTTVASDDTAIERMRLTHEGDLNLITDNKSIQLGADSDTTLTHVHDTGLLLNSTRQLQFGDSGTYIHQSADGVLDLVSDTEIEINATTIDVNGNMEVSGTGNFGGTLECATQFSIGSAQITEAELETIDGVTPGTASASKALVVDSSKNISSIGNLSASEVTATSDEKLKSDIKTIENGLDKVMKMRGVSFTKQAEKGIGVIAQEVEKIIPEVVHDGEYKSVAYGNMVGVLIEAIKELKTELDNHKQGCKCHGS